MYSTHITKLYIPHLPAAACQVHIVPDLASHTLLSIRQLCNAGSDVTFNPNGVIVTYQDCLILQGTRTATTRLWHFDLPHPAPPPPLDPNEHHVMSAIGSATPAELVTFAHAALFSPAPSTLAIVLKKGFVQNFPGLTKKTLAKYPPRLYAIVKGHMDQARKNQKSTKTATAPTDPDDDFPPLVPDARSHFCCRPDQNHWPSLLRPDWKVHVPLQQRK
jgi:hypothetical protein